MADRAVGIPMGREGLPFVAAAGGLTALAGSLGWVAPAVVLGTLTLLTAWFFRNPRRHAPQTAGAVVAPGDGRVLAVHEEYEPRFLKDRSTRVSIFLSIFDVHVTRIPCDGTIEKIAYQSGRFLAANRPEAKLRNEKNGILMRTALCATECVVQMSVIHVPRIGCV